jgi:hypothetical protein
MKATPITPVCNFETVSAPDVLSGLNTLNGRYGQGIIVQPPGDGPDKPLNWAIQEIITAADAPTKEERERLSTDAMLNSRRALACLVDWYLERDLINCCKNPPSDAKRKARCLVSRGIIDELTSRVLERAISERNQVEHRYLVPLLETAEDVVELLRRTISAIRSQSEPSHAPWIFGSFLHSLGSSEKGPYAEFHGWTQPLLVLWRFGHRPWVGIVIPEGSSKAAVRRAFLDETGPEELIAILSVADLKYGRPSFLTDIKSAGVLAKTMSLCEA